jgi:hypothetical protein
MQTVAAADLDSIPRWHFAVGGLQTQQHSFSLGPAIVLRRLQAFPTPEQLALSLKSLPVAGMMAHYGEAFIQHELVLDSEYIDDTRLIPATAEAVLAGLRVRTGAEIICPAVCERSWGALAGVTGNSCRAYHVERGLSGNGASALVLHDDLEWVRKHLGRLTELTENERFETAIDALCSYMHAANDRMKAAQLWAGVEAVFGRRFGEVGYRLSVLTALLLESRGPACRTLFKDLRKLYNARSDAVHGSKMKEAALAKHVADVRGILARLLRRIIELGKVPSDDELEDMTFLP